MTNDAAVMACDANNLKPVALAIRGLYPGKLIVVCADNDRSTEGNPGLTKATAAAKAVKASLAVPEFQSDEAGTDFNDLALLGQNERIIAAVSGAATPEEPTRKPSKTLGAAVRVLESAPWSGLIGFNAFRQRIEKRQPTPYGGKPGPWLDWDSAELMLWLERETAAAFGRDTVELAVMTVARRNTFNPAEDRLRALAEQWDHTRRLESWLVDSMSAKASEGNAAYLREIGAAWLKGVAARVLKPGCKRDDVLVLRGPQGWRKSTAAGLIADAIHLDAFTDSVDLANLAEAKIQIRGVIIAELGELNGMRKAEVEATKVFCIDSHRSLSGKIRTPCGRLPANRVFHRFHERPQLSQRSHRQPALVARHARTAHRYRPARGYLAATDRRSGLPGTGRRSLACNRRTGTRTGRTGTRGALR